MAEREDKEVYNYTTSLKQPTWITKITSTISLPNSYKLSMFVWWFSFYLLFMYLALKFLKGLPLPTPFWGALFLAPSFYLGNVFSDLTIQEQSISRFIRDYLKMYRRYGRKRKKYYLNDGIFYVRPLLILKKGR